MRHWIAAKGATSYECQLGPIWISWTYLQGGHWRYWWQPSRWNCGYDRNWRIPEDEREM